MQSDLTLETSRGSHYCQFTSVIKFPTIKQVAYRFSSTEVIYKGML